MHHFKGTVWRHIPAGAHPLHAGRILHALGRWNRSGVFGCLYTALTIEGARAEYEKHFGAVGSTPDMRARRELVSIEIDVGPVLDLTDIDVCDQLTITPTMLVGDGEDTLELCRTIATWGRTQGYRAILSPSAAAAGEVNLMIYLDGTAEHLHLEVGADRIPLVR